MKTIETVPTKKARYIFPEYIRTFMNKNIKTIIHKILFPVLGGFPLLFFTGCVTVPPLYETSTIRKGFTPQCGFSYEWADYKGDTLTYSYDFLRMDLLGSYGFTDRVSIDARLYGAVGKGRYSTPTEDGEIPYYFGVFGGIRLSPFPSERIVPAIQVGIQTFLFIPMMSSALLLGVKDEEGHEFLTLGIRTLSYLPEYVVPYAVCVSLHPKVWLNPASISFGMSLFPLNESKPFKNGLNPQDFSVGIGFNF